MKKNYLKKWLACLFVMFMAGCQPPENWKVPEQQDGEAWGEAEFAFNKAQAAPSWKWYEQQAYKLYSDTNVGTNSILMHSAVQLPFFADTSPAGHDLYHPDIRQVDMWPEDGWVLLKRDFGTPNRAPSFPYFMLYNRLSGTLRFIFYYPQVDNRFTYAQVTLTHQNNFASTPLLSFPESKQCSLKDYAADQTLFAIAQLANRSWAYADFPLIAFDSQIFGKQAYFWLEVKGVQKSEIALDGNISLEQVFKNAGVNSSYTNPMELINGGTEVYESYKSTAKFVNGFKQWSTSKNFTTNTSGLTDIAGAIPYVGAAIGAVKFFVGLFKKPAAPVPICFEGKLNLKGTITLNNPQFVVGFMVPGTQLNHQTAYAEDSDTNNTTEYKKPLGIFSLKETPVVRYKENIALEWVLTANPSNGNLTIGYKDTGKRELFGGIEKALAFSINANGLKGIGGRDYTVSGIEVAFVWSDPEVTKKRYNMSADTINADFYVPLSEFNNIRRFANDPFVEIYRKDNLERLKTDLIYFGDYDQAKSKQLAAGLFPQLAVKVTIEPVNNTNPQDKIVIMKSYEPIYRKITQTIPDDLELGYTESINTPGGIFYVYHKITPFDEVSFFCSPTVFYPGQVYTAIRKLEIKNRGTVPLNIGAITITGKAAQFMTIVKNPTYSILQPGGKAVLEIKCQAQSVFSGQTADLVIERFTTANDHALVYYTLIRRPS